MKKEKNINVKYAINNIFLIINYKYIIKQQNI